MYLDVLFNLTSYVTQSSHLEILKNVYFAEFISDVLGISYKTKALLGINVFWYKLCFDAVTMSAVLYENPIKEREKVNTE